jgi:hypothetical protein
MSTLALEFHRLPLAKALRYVLASVVVAQVSSEPAENNDDLVQNMLIRTRAVQLTLLVTLGAATFRPLQDAIAAPPPIDACAGFEQLCRSLLSSIGCPESDATAIGCEGSSLSGFKGRCTCASLDAGHRIAELLIDSQSAGLTVGALAPVWPVGGGIDTLGGAAVGGFGAWPTDVFDACLSFDNLCDSTLSRFACSPSDRAIASCSRRGLTFFDPLCACGGFAAASTRVLDLIVDTQLSLGKSLFDVRSYPTSRSLDFCAAYEIVCRRSLAHVQCPADSILIHGCNESGTTASLAPVCRCYSPGNEVVAGWDLSGAVIAATVYTSFSSLCPTLLPQVISSKSSWTFSTNRTCGLTYAPSVVPSTLRLPFPSTCAQCSIGCAQISCRASDATSRTSPLQLALATHQALPNSPGGACAATQATPSHLWRRLAPLNTSSMACLRKTWPYGTRMSRHLGPPVRTWLEAATSSSSCRQSTRFPATPLRLAEISKCLEAHTSWSPHTIRMSDSHVTGSLQYF